MLPSSPLRMLLAKAMPLLVAASRNRAKMPLAVTEEEARRQLSGIADGFLDYDREIWARGYVPATIPTGDKAGPVVWAADGEMKNTFCVMRDGRAYLSRRAPLEH